MKTLNRNRKGKYNKRYGLPIGFSEIILLALIAILAFSCGKKEIRCVLPKGLIPYELGQIISFTDNEGETIDLTVTENKTKWVRQDLDSGGMIDLYYSWSEVKTVILKSEANNLEIKLENGYAYGEGDASCKDASVYINFYINDSWKFEYRLKYDCEGNFRNNDNIFLHENLEINGKVYYDVIELKEYYFLLYNQAYGILQISIDGAHFLTINPKDK